MGVEVLGESQKLSMSFTEGKKLMGRGYGSGLGCVEFEDPEGHSGGNTQLQLGLRRESGDGQRMVNNCRSRCDHLWNGSSPGDHGLSGQDSSGMSAEERVGWNCVVLRTLQPKLGVGACAGGGGGGLSHETRLWGNRELWPRRLYSFFP